MRAIRARIGVTGYRRKAISSKISSDRYLTNSSGASSRERMQLLGLGRGGATLCAYLTEYLGLDEGEYEYLTTLPISAVR